MTVIAGPCIISRFFRFFSHFFVFQQQYAVFRHSPAVGHLAVLIEAEGLIPGDGVAVRGQVLPCPRLSIFTPYWKAVPEAFQDKPQFVLL